MACRVRHRSRSDHIERSLEDPGVEGLLRAWSARCVSPLMLSLRPLGIDPS